MSTGPVLRAKVPVASQPGFWCECILTSPHRENTVLVGSFAAPDARDAVRWIRIAVRMLVSILDDTAAEPVHDWLLLGGSPTAARLERGEPFTIVLPNDQLRLAWSARPVRYLPLAHRTRSLPPCAEEWAQPAALRAALTSSPDRP
ncbi:hypothetical protein [Streptomyces sp. NPDC006879]|uniref:hypothetical protein n=1 Tax=Streptomyces sp. NPDC006879 TaxID=3364767 RepID=UPI0036C0A0F1